MSEEQKGFDFGGHVKHIEDAQSVDLPLGDKTLSDEELEQGGLVKTSAFVRTRRSKNALRIEKNREKKAAKGVKQLNVEVPEEHRGLMKAMAKAMKEGFSPVDALQKVLPDFDQGAELLGQKSGDNEQKGKKISEKEHFSENVINWGRTVKEIKQNGGVRSLLLKLAGV